MLHFCPYFDFGCQSKVKVGMAMVDMGILHITLNSPTSVWRQQRARGLGTGTGQGFLLLLTATALVLSVPGTGIGRL